MPASARNFRPPHCPDMDCDSHSSPDTWRFIKKGFFFRDKAPRVVQRYRCQRCGRNFSSQTFSTTYWLKRCDLFESLFMKLVGCMALRQVGRELGVSKSTLQRHSERLGRHCALFNELRRPECPNEPLVLDGFRTFEHSQYWPLDVNLVVGQSGYVYGASDAPLRRSGTMAPRQKAKRAVLEKRHGRPDPQATSKSVEEVLRRVIPPGAKVELATDEHQAYPRAIARLTDREIMHSTTSSKAARIPTNPLFAVNQTDHLIRHSSANHKRETIAFSKRRQNLMYRMEIFSTWKNHVKDQSENRRDGPPAKALGLIDRALTVSEILKERIFPWKLTGWLERCYYGRIETAVLPINRTHELTYAR